MRKRIRFAMVDFVFLEICNFSGFLIIKNRLSNALFDLTMFNVFFKKHIVLLSTFPFWDEIIDS